MHIEIDDDLVAKVDQLAGARNRSRFVRRAVELAVDREPRWRRLEAAAGSITAEDYSAEEITADSYWGHQWDRSGRDA